MGELHLEILRKKLTRDMKVEVLVGKPKVAYKETITRKAEARGKHVKQSGGRGQYGRRAITIGPFRGIDPATHQPHAPDGLKKLGLPDGIASHHKSLGGSRPRAHPPSTEHHLVLGG